jgi:hypothetical protein
VRLKSNRGAIRLRAVRSRRATARSSRLPDLRVNNARRGETATAHSPRDAVITKQKEPASVEERQDREVSRDAPCTRKGMWCDASLVAPAEHRGGRPGDSPDAFLRSNRGANQDREISSEKCVVLHESRVLMLGYGGSQCVRGDLRHQTEGSSVTHAVEVSRQRGRWVQRRQRAVVKRAAGHRPARS